MTGEAVVLHGGAERLDRIGDGTVRLVVTSPPFFDEATEVRLREPVSRQRDFEGVQADLFGYADTLSGAFREIARVLATDGTLVLHTKDIRYADLLVPLAARHEALAHAAGLRTRTRILWMPTDRPQRSGKRIIVSPARGVFRAPDTEMFVVLRPPFASKRRGEALPSLRDAEWLADPIWRTPGETTYPRHRHASPPVPLTRFVELFSAPGDLVLDPFCGGGGVLDVARRMGRRAVGVDSNLACVEASRSRVEAA